MTRAAQVALAVCTGVLPSIAQAPSAIRIPNFSGTYVSTQKPKKGSPPEKVIVSQTAEALEITRFSPEGKPVTNRLRFDGSVADYVSSVGFHGKGRLQWKRGQLVVEVVENTVVDDYTIPIHMTQRWQLSQDGALLSIKMDVDCPQDQQMEPNMLSGSLHSCTSVFGGYPITEKYQRISQPD